MIGEIAAALKGFVSGPWGSANFPIAGLSPGFCRPGHKRR